MKSYPAYKHSGVPWLGEIPEHWKIVPYRAFFGERKTPNSNLQETNLLSLSYGNIIRKDINKAEGLVPASYSSYNIIEAEDIVLRLTDLQNDHKSLRTGLCKQRGIITSAYVTLRPLNSEVCSAYFQYQLYRYDVSKCIYAGGGGVRQTMNFDSIIRLHACAPPLSEQAAIAAYLDKKCGEIDEMVRRRQAIIERLRELKQALIAKAVTKGLHPEVPMKDSGIPWLGEIPEHWTLRPLRTLMRRNEVRGFPKHTLLSVVREKGIIVRNTESKEENHNFIPDDLSKYKLVRKGQFVINKMKAWQGSYGISDYEGIVSPAYFVYSMDNSSLLPAFFHTAIRSMAYIPFFSRYSDGVRIGQWDLDEAEMKKITFYCPPLPEQSAIVAYLDQKCAAIDELISRHGQIVEKLRELKASTIAHVVTGKIDIRERA
ncbi:MAG: restriction endonuclease subunit S [Akkermansia muciniphila]|nr:restriction endonuclease subunit S [Akkermansia muciniphila]